MDNMNILAGQRAEFHDQGERIPEKAVIWDALQREISLHDNTKKRLAEMTHLLGLAEAKMGRSIGHDV